MDARTPSLGVEAKIIFGSADYTVVGEGSFVRCAVTGRRIPLSQLRYWNPELQEAYADAEAALTRWRQLSDQAATENPENSEAPQ